VAIEMVSAVAGGQCPVCCGHVLVWRRTEVLREK
jgi:hypothetical protein